MQSGKSTQGFFPLLAIVQAEASVIISIRVFSALSRDRYHYFHPFCLLFISATARVQLAGKAFRVAGIEPNKSDTINGDCYSASLVTLAPLDNDCTVAVAPEENEVSSSISQIDASIQSIFPLPRHEQRGAKRNRKSQKSEIMTSSPFKNFLDKNEKEKVELEEVKANRVFKKNKNGDKTKRRKALKAKKKFILNSIENPVPSQVRQIMRGQYAQAANTHMTKIGCSVDYVRSGGMRNVPVTKAVSICMRLLLNFQGAYSWPRPAYSYPSRRMPKNFLPPHFFHPFAATGRCGGLVARPRFQERKIPS
ncbi:hypothetical protein AVEN_144166-1 [Araneus ventricosus]|uniref:Uncharacterized protein n=1 Tax=Araneus ventricosus TaxID=182803 RepID=A0A4Y2GAU6_ARAVE|nr:hypothetical protein AVEN_144166-1 [Araneus ventricosus]